ncbi:MAG: hypothetical protein ACOZDY_00845 [Pseudomonadota bacterium]
MALTFHLCHPAVEHADLDNLAKPVLDTIFCARFAQAPSRDVTGVLFDVDDARLYHLTVEKRIAAAETDEGVDVTVDWD